MISVLLFAAAATGNFLPPKFTADDASRMQEAYRENSSIAVLIDAKVDPKGRVTDCKAQPEAGNKDAAAGICSQAERLKVQPASVAGGSAYGALRTMARFVVASDSAGDKVRTVQQPADMELQVNKLPAGQSTLRIVANVLIDDTGKPEACYAAAANDAPKAYGDVACTQISPVTFGVLKDDNGKPVRYVREVVLDFTTSPSPDRAPASDR